MVQNNKSDPKFMTKVKKVFGKIINKKVEIEKDQRMSAQELIDHT